jgi:hypothetical protein
MGMRGGPPTVHGIWNPVVGHGGIYEFSSKDGGKQTMEMAIVGKETVDGKDAFWYQIVMDSSDAGGKMVMKHLMIMDGRETHAARIIMQFPNHPPMEMSGQMGQRQHAKQAADLQTEAQDVGSETITVPAGTFTCEHYRLNDGSGDAWVAKNVTPYGVVKYQGKDSSMTLMKVITDAKDKIVGKPVPFNPQAFMQQPPQ